MRYRALSDTGDMRFGNQQQNFLRDTPETVAQAVLTRLRLWLGEWFFDQTEGTPYQQAALGKHPLDSVDPAFRSRILNTQGVTSIDEFSVAIDPDERTVSVSATINTQYGTAQVVGVL